MLAGVALKSCALAVPLLLCPMLVLGLRAADWYRCWHLTCRDGMTRGIVQVEPRCEGCTLIPAHEINDSRNRGSRAGTLFVSHAAAPPTPHAYCCANWRIGMMV